MRLTSLFLFTDDLSSNQGPFSGEQLSKWNKAGYLHEGLHVRKRSTLKGMNGGAFIEIQRLQNNRNKFKPFEQKSKDVIVDSIEMLDELLSVMSEESSPPNEMAPKEEDVTSGDIEKKTESWIQMTDPDSGVDYYYNTKTGESSWSLPESVIEKE